MLYELILRAFQSSKDFDEKEKIRKQNKLTPVIHYIDQHYHTPILLNELAEVIGVSAPYLCDIFKKTYHVSPQTYIINMRIEHAKRQLCRNKHMTIKDIALENGFNDASYFCNVFKKTTGMTPNEFRIANTYRAGKTWEEFN